MLFRKILYTTETKSVVHADCGAVNLRNGMRGAAISAGFRTWTAGYEGIFIVCFLLGNSPASEVYMPTFRNTLFHLHRQVGVKND